MKRSRAGLAIAAATTVLVVGCYAPAEVTPQGPTHGSHTQVDTAETPLREGERFVDVGLPEAYSPKAPTTGTDDYRCFLLDPKLDRDAFVTGIDVAPDRPDLVHHVILFRVPPEGVAAAQSHDDAEPGQGWTCFGGSGLDGAGASLDNAPWLGAWAPGGGERMMANDIGIPLERGSRIVMQVHYNLLGGSGPDQSTARLRMARGDKQLAPLETMLLPGPVELPCRPRADGPLCEREAALADVRNRFGDVTAQTADFLSLMCLGTGPSPTQSCTRAVTERATIRAVAGHMHLLGKSIGIKLNPGRSDAQTLLDVPEWNFDNQGSVPVDEPVPIGPGDEIRVTCEHDQALRDRLPAFEGQPERYVVWGEGTTDEMCLGIVLLTRP
ncbi:MAG TPA: hypothetical protein VFD59_14045 [Nocardioidaceae bacterium]|nr:hypothetical protein [Nocardioidaceae bacterium]